MSAAARALGRLFAELHDVVAHSVSVMTIQAGAARMLLDDDPEKARQLLIAVEETGHQALAEMRRLLGVLRGSDDTALTPQPGMAQLGALVEQTRSAGPPVDVDGDGSSRPLAPGIDLTAYRIVPGGTDERAQARWRLRDAGHATARRALRGRATRRTSRGGRLHGARAASDHRRGGMIRILIVDD